MCNGTIFYLKTNQEILCAKRMRAAIVSVIVECMCVHTYYYNPMPKPIVTRNNIYAALQTTFGGGQKLPIMNL